ncbi:MAG: hypothetical protein NTU44_17735 [Bacteroidetes bacterium]|nr:hypothetical protein [Bacteroidota bacterium]
MIKGEMVLSKIGFTVQDLWFEIPEHYPNASLGPFIIMPDHIHGIISIDTLNQAIDMKNPNYHNKLHLWFNKSKFTISDSVSVMVGTFKAAVTRWCNQNGYKYFAWHPRFHDRVIRNNYEYQQIAKYIENNPKIWQI